jgi:hypothetical protein
MKLRSLRGTVINRKFFIEISSFFFLMSNNFKFFDNLVKFFLGISIISPFHFGKKIIKNTLSVLISISVFLICTSQLTQDVRVTLAI